MASDESSWEGESIALASDGSSWEGESIALSGGFSTQEEKGVEEAIGGSRKEKIELACAVSLFKDHQFLLGVSGVLGLCVETTRPKAG